MRAAFLAILLTVFLPAEIARAEARG